MASQQQRELNEAKRTAHQSLDQAKESAGHAKGGVQATVEGAKNNVQDSAYNMYGGAKDSLTSFADKSGQIVVQARDGIGSMLNNAKHTVTENTEKTKESAQQNGGKAQEEGKGYLQYVGDMVSQSAVSLKETLVGKSEQVKAASQDTVQQAKEKSSQGLEATEQSFRNLKIDAESGANGQKGLLQAFGEKVSQTTQAAMNAVTPAGSRTSESTETDVKRAKEEAKHTEEAAARKLRESGQKVEEKANRAADEVQSKGFMQAVGEQVTYSAQAIKDKFAGAANTADERMRADETGRKLVESKDAVKQGLNDGVQKGGKQGEGGKGMLQAMGERATQSAQSVKDTIGAKANEAQGVTHDQAQNALYKVQEFENIGAKSRAEKGSEMAQEKKEEGKGFMQTMGDKISQSAASARESVIGKPSQ